MPTFRFKCSNCGNEFDFLILPGREEEVSCSKCGGKDVEKMITGFYLSNKPSGNDSSGGSSGSCPLCNL